MWYGFHICAAVGGAATLRTPLAPLPAISDTFPLVRARTVWLPASTKKSVLPVSSKTIPRGAFSSAAERGIEFVLKPQAEGVPSHVLMVPFIDTTRIVQLLPSDSSTSPVPGSITTIPGVAMSAEVAGPPSPPYPLTPVPANVVIVPLAVTARTTK